jgi:DNA-binding response OmpR family regulator
MKNENLGYYFKKALLIEDCHDICDFYKSFFEMEELPLEIMTTIPEGDFDMSQYDLVVCDWFVGANSAEKWLRHLNDTNQLPLATVVATGLLEVEDIVNDLPIHLIFKPFAFCRLRDFLVEIVAAPRSSPTKLGLGDVKLSEIEPLMAVSI